MASEVDRAGWFLENACPDHHVRGGPDHWMARDTAMAVLDRHPEIARASLYTAVVCGELTEVERILAARPHPQREALAQLLLERGAEPYDSQVLYNIHFRGDVLWWLKRIHAQPARSGSQADWSADLAAARSLDGAAERLRG